MDLLYSPKVIKKIQTTKLDYILFLIGIITYDKDGKVIDKKQIGIGLCGASPGFRCEEFSVIQKDFSIYASDTIAEAEIDSLGQEIKSTLQKYVIYIKGRLLSNGKIELSDTLRQTLNK